MTKKTISNAQTAPETAEQKAARLEAEEAKLQLDIGNAKIAAINAGAELTMAKHAVSVATIKKDETALKAAQADFVEANKSKLDANEKLAEAQDALKAWKSAVKAERDAIREQRKAEREEKRRQSEGRKATRAKVQALVFLRDDLLTAKHEGFDGGKVAEELLAKVRKEIDALVKAHDFEIPEEPDFETEAAKA